MTLAVAEALPDDPETPKAMLIAELIPSERLAQIIKGHAPPSLRAAPETPPTDQPLLALDDAEQSEAKVAAEVEATSLPMRAEGVGKRRANRGALLGVWRKPRHPALLPRAGVLPSTSRRP